MIIKNEVGGIDGFHGSHRRCASFGVVPISQMMLSTQSVYYRSFLKSMFLN